MTPVPPLSTLHWLTRSRFSGRILGFATCRSRIPGRRALPTPLVPLSICLSYSLAQFVFLRRIKISKIYALQETFTEDFLHYSCLAEAVTCPCAAV